MIAGGTRWIEYPSRGDVIRLRSLGDFHWDERACARDEIIAVRDEIAADDHAFAFGMGDYGSYLAPTDPRFDPSTVAEDIMVYEMGQLGHALTARIKDLFTPIRLSLLGLGMGNHEYEYMKRMQQQQLHHWMCTELGVPDHGYCSIFSVVFVRNSRLKAPRLRFTCPLHPSKGGTHSSAWRIRVFHHHGAGAAQTKGGRINRLEKFMHDWPERDLYLMAHVHDQVSGRWDHMGGNKNDTDVVEHTKLAVVTGGFLRGYDVGSTGYVERKGLRPTVMGAAEICFEPDKRTMWSSQTADAAGVDVPADYGEGEA